MEREFNEEYLVDYVNTDKVSIGDYVLGGDTVEDLIRMIEHREYNVLKDFDVCRIIDRNKYSFVIENKEGNILTVPFVYKWEGVTPDPKTYEVLSRVYISADNREDAINRIFKACDDSGEEMKITILDNREVE